jgi:hypothetical protein
MKRGPVWTGMICRRSTVFETFAMHEPFWETIIIASNKNASPGQDTPTLRAHPAVILADRQQMVGLASAAVLSTL